MTPHDEPHDGGEPTDRRAPARTAPKKEGLLGWATTFLSEKYEKQPKWLRTTVYMLFAGLVALAMYQGTLGEFSVQGRVLRKTADGSLRPVQGVEVRVGDKYFGTNSRGMYYMVLGPSEYLTLYSSRMIQIDVSDSVNVYPRQTLSFTRMRKELQDITLDNRVASAGVTLSEYSPPTPARDGFSLVQNAWAFKQDMPVVARLFVTGIRTTHGRQARIALRGGTSADLMSARFRSAAGSIPVAARERVVFGQDYYLPVTSARGLTQSSIVMTTPEAEETFPIRAEPAAGKEMTLKGDEGSELTLVRLSPYDVTIFVKDDIRARLPALKDALKANAFRIVEMPAPLGTAGQTNALFGGSGVPYGTMQQVLKTVIDARIALKTVRPGLRLATNNPYEIQIGGVSAINGSAALPQATLAKLMSAPNAAEFTRHAK
jgi:hypothetical protein